MTEKNVQEIEDAALGAYMRSRKTLEVAKERVKRVSAEMKKLSDELCFRSGEELSSAKIESYSWLNPEAIRDLAADVKQAEAELETARAKAVKLGVSIQF